MLVAYDQGAQELQCASSPLSAPVQKTRRTPEAEQAGSLSQTGGHAAIDTSPPALQSTLGLAAWDIRMATGDLQDASKEPS